MPMHTNKGSSATGTHSQCPRRDRRRESGMHPAETASGAAGTREVLEIRSYFPNRAAIEATRIMWGSTIAKATMVRQFMTKTYDFNVRKWAIFQSLSS